MQLFIVVNYFKLEISKVLLISVSVCICPYLGNNILINNPIDIFVQFNL